MVETVDDFHEQHGIAERERVGCSSSRWPGGFLLDEVWLRARRHAVHGLERMQLHLTEREYLDMMADQSRLGNQLISEVLRPVLGFGDYAQIRSESMFGVTNTRFQQRLPFTLAFGYELGLGLLRLQAEENALARERAKLCGLFNLGISLFDLLHDHHPDLVESFSEVFDEPVLTRVQNDPKALSELESEIENLEAPELRVLLRIIVAYFRGVYRHCGSTGGDSERLQELLLESYRAEMHSVSSNKSNSELSRIARAKSTLPFLVIRELARIKTTEDQARRVDVAAEDIGEIFWRIDELMDLVLDFRNRSLNSLLLPKSDTPMPVVEAYSRDALIGLLESRELENAADELVAALLRLRQGLRFNGSCSKHGQCLFLVVRAYVQDWIN